MKAIATNAAVQPTRPGWQEWGWAAAGLAALMTFQLVSTHALSLFQAHFWLDELFTYAIVSEPDLPRAMQSLAHAVDTNPPCLHLLLRLFTGLVGSQNEPAFRCFALLAMFVALLGIYRVLREVFPPLSALAGMLAVWCHPLILRHAFEARFYGPWLAGVVWYAYFLARALGSPRRYGWLIAVGATSIFVCTIHYFGVITLALVTLFELSAHRPWGKRQLACLTAVALGPIALLACSPFFLGQRSVLTVGSWIEPPDLAGAVVGMAPGLAIVCLYFLRGLFARHLPADRDPSAVLGLVSLVLLPPALILFSLTIQPATLARYILPSLATLGPLAAGVSLLLPRPGRLLLCLAFVAGSAYGLHNLAELYRTRDQQTDELIRAIRELPEDTPIAFEFTNSLYVVDHYAPDLSPRCFFLDFERGQLQQASNHRITTRDVARQYVKYRGQPGLMPWLQFRTLPNRFLVPGEELTEPIPDPEQRFPGFTLQPRRAGIYELMDEYLPARKSSRDDN
jgi:hypothetical protein